jgi:putative selenium metabolism hydrolase
MITAARILKESGYRTASTPSTSPLPSWKRTATACAGSTSSKRKDSSPISSSPPNPPAAGSTAATGAAWKWRFGSRAFPAHGSAPERGVSAAYKAAKAALAMEQLNEDLKPDDDNFLGKGTIVVSQMTSHGPSQCAVPDQAMLYLDRRLTWGEDAESWPSRRSEEYVPEATGRRRGRVDVTMPDYTQARLEKRRLQSGALLPTWKIDEDHQIVGRASPPTRASTASDPVVDKWTFSTNLVATTGRHGIPAIGFGPGDEDQAHAPNEINRVADLEICSAFYALLPVALED